MFWPEGSAGRRDFTLTLLTAPSHSILSASLANPSARAVLQPLAAVANILVDSPVVSITTNLVRNRHCTCLSPPSAPAVLSVLPSWLDVGVCDWATLCWDLQSVVSSFLAALLAFTTWLLC